MRGYPILLEYFLFSSTTILEISVQTKTNTEKCVMRSNTFWQLDGRIEKLEEFVKDDTNHTTATNTKDLLRAEIDARLVQPLSDLQKIDKNQTLSVSYIIYTLWLKWKKPLI